jgi:hypothetical protein
MPITEVIEATVVLANALLHKESVSIKELNKIRKDMEVELPDCYVDICGLSLSMAENEYPDLFIWNTDYSFTRKMNWSEYFIDEIFNRRLSADIRQKVKSLIQKSLSSKE